MLNRRIKFLVLLIFAVSLTITMASCDMGETVETYVLTIEVVGEGDTEPGPDTHEYEEGTTVGLEAIPDEDWEFDSWEGNVQNSDAAETTILMESNETVTAVFEEEEIESEEYELTIDIEGKGNTIPEEGTHKYEEGTTVDLEAIPKEGWEFVEWTRDVESTDKEISVAMDSDKELTAHFVEKTAYFEIDIDEASDNEVSLEEKLTIKAEIENNGDIGDTQEVEMIFQEEIIDTENITLDAGEDTTEEFTHEVSDEAELGYTDVFIESNDDIDEHEVYVTEFAGGRGTEDSPYLIETAEQLDKVRDYLESHFKQISNIDLSDYSLGAGWNPIGDEENKFKGNFDGNGHEISNLTIDRPETDCVGLFGYIDNSEITNIILIDVEIIGNSNVGSVVGRSFYGDIINSSASGSLKGNLSQVGGIVGWNEFGKVENSHSTVKVTGTHAIGGVAGFSSNGDVINCYSEGDITGISRNAGGLVGRHSGGNIVGSYATGRVYGEKSLYSALGGLVGLNYRGGVIENSFAKGNVIGYNDEIGGLVGLNESSIENSYAKGSITGEEGDYIGGLVGDNEGTINSSYATGDVTGERKNTGGLVGRNRNTISESFSSGSVEGNKYTGGLVGNNHEGTFDNSYSVGDVTGTENVGGLAGWNRERIEYSYAAGEVTGNSNTGGLVGYDEAYIDYSYYDKDIAGIDEENGTPKSTNEMIQHDTFTPEWNFDTIWDIDEDNSYPYLQWQEGESIPVPPDN